MDTDYLEQKAEQRELQEYTEKEDWVYSNPYYDSDSGNDKRRICYAIPMYDKRRYGHLKATLYLEMNLEYFLTQVKAYAETQDLVALIGNGSEILYQKDKKNVLRNAIKEKELDQENIYHTSNGYLICIPVEGTRVEALYVSYSCRSSEKQQFCAGIFCALLFTLCRTGATRCFQNPGEYGASGDGTVKADGTHGVWQTAADPHCPYRR